MARKGTNSSLRSLSVANMNRPARPILPCDTIGREGVGSEFEARGIDSEAGARLLDFFEGLARVDQSVTQTGTALNADSPYEAANAVVLERIAKFVGEHEAGARGADELRQIL